jgi:S1-C subfamily serine protease
LTNAHCVADASYVTVRRHGSAHKSAATVAAVGHEADLALLCCEDPRFWDAAPVAPLPLGDVPALQEAVSVVGFPSGGDNLSITRGVVSRVELTQYVHGAAHLLAVQLDAAINPGNSGGPALRDGGTVVGLAFQNLPAADNIGFIIPPPIIRRFLDDVVATGSHTGFCALGARCQPVENAALRAYLRLPAGTTGVLVNSVTPLTSAADVLRKDDVITAFDGTPIGADGSVALRRGERVSFDHLVSLKRPGDCARLSLIRDGAPAEVSLRLAPAPTLVPVQLYDRLPSYFVYAGLVFAPLSQPHLHESGEDWYNTAPRRLTHLALHGTLKRAADQVVLLSQVLVDDVNAGYQAYADTQVHACDGVRVRNLRHLRRLLSRGGGGAFIRLDLDHDRVLVLDRAAAEGAHARILARHRVPSPVSADLLAEDDARSDAQQDEQDNEEEEGNAKQAGTAEA